MEAKIIRVFPTKTNATPDDETASPSPEIAAYPSRLII